MADITAGRGPDDELYPDRRCAALLTSWADAWRSDPAALARCYAPGASVLLLGELAARGPEQLEGRADLAAHTDRVVLRVPDRDVQLQRCLTGRMVAHAGDGAAPDVLVAEWLLTGRSAEDLVTMVAPMVTWWQLAGPAAATAIAAEVRIVDWSERRILDAHEGRARPLAPGPRRSTGWYVDFVARFHEVAAFDPDLARRSAHADAYSENGRPSLHARAAARRFQVPGAVPDVAGVAGRHNTVAELLGRSDPHAVVVAELDDDDRVVAERGYGGSWFAADGTN